MTLGARVGDTILVAGHTIETVTYPFPHRRSTNARSIRRRRTTPNTGGPNEEPHRPILAGREIEDRPDL